MILYVMLGLIGLVALYFLGKGIVMYLKEAFAEQEAKGAFDQVRIVNADGGFAVQYSKGTKMPEWKQVDYPHTFDDLIEAKERLVQFTKRNLKRRQDELDKKRRIHEAQQAREKELQEHEMLGVGMSINDVKKNLGEEWV